MFSIESLEIAGYRDEPVPNTFYRQEGETRHLGILLPGIRYTTQAPLLFYPGRLLLASGADVLQVEYAYSQKPEFESLPDARQERWIFADVEAACQVALEQRPYQRLILIGKSLGTLAMGYLLSSDILLDDVRAVWLTPLLRVERLYAEMRQWEGPSLFVIGTEDPHYDPQRLADLQEATGGDTVVVVGGDHILDVRGDLWESLRALEQVMRAIEVFLE